MAACVRHEKLNAIVQGVDDHKYEEHVRQLRGMQYAQNREIC